MIIKEITDEGFDDIQDNARKNNQCLTMLLPIIFMANSHKIKSKHNNSRSAYVDYNQKILDQRFIPCINYQGHIDYNALECNIDSLPEGEEMYFGIQRKYYNNEFLQILKNNKRNFIVVLKENGVKLSGC